MDFYFGLVCSFLLSLANVRTLTTQIPTAYPLYPNFDNCGFNLSATCDDHMNLFADGNLLDTSDDWRNTSVVYIPPNTGKIEIRCTDRWILGGILASSDNGLITNNAWNCSSDNGVTWHLAHELGANGVTSTDISPDAKWIWTDRPTWRHTILKNHATAICTIQLPNNTDCSTSTPTPISTRNCTGLFNGTTPIPTPKSVTGFNLNATCNNKMELFVDGNLRATSYNWRDTSPVHISENTQTIEIRCSDSCWLIEGILASSDNGLITDHSWTCSSDNGITWSSAHEIVSNGLSVPDISPSAKWISTGQSTWRLDGGKVICKVNLGCEYTDKYVECPEFKEQCNSKEFSDCMMTDCAKTCNCTSSTTINAIATTTTTSATTTTASTSTTINPETGRGLSLTAVIIAIENTVHEISDGLQNSTNGRYKRQAETFSEDENELLKEMNNLVNYLKSNCILEIHTCKPNDIETFRVQLSSIFNNIQRTRNLRRSNSEFVNAVEVKRKEFDDLIIHLGTPTCPYEDKTNILCKCGQDICSEGDTCSGGKCFIECQATTVQPRRKRASSQRFTNNSVSTWEQTKSDDCWRDCGEKGGACPSFCGSNGYCCRKGYDGCPPGAGETSPNKHTCFKEKEPELNGYCLTSGGHDQNSGNQSLNAGGKDACYHQCKAVPQATGCEWHKHGSCTYHTLDVATGNGNSDYTCWVFNSSPTDSASTTIMTSTTPTTIGTTGNCPTGWTSLTTGCYKLTDNGNHEQAASNCSSAGGFLAEIDNQEEHNAVSSFTQERVWLGATDTAKEGDWIWSNSGQKITFNNWNVGAGEPNGGPGENCLEGNRYGDSTWNDLSCSNNLRGLCELGNCPTGWTSLTTGCYKLTDSGNHEQAASNCSGAGGFLAEIDNQEEHNAVSSFTQERVWLGATDTAKEGDWIWSNSGQKITFNNWNAGAGEPNGGTRENCLEGNRYENSTWNDLSCSNNLRGLCELGSTFRCPEEFIEDIGDVPGGGIRGGFSVKSIRECGQACEQESTCNSFNYSPTKQWCVIYHETQPTADKFEDYGFCTKKQGSPPRKENVDIAYTCCFIVRSSGINGTNQTYVLTNPFHKKCEGSSINGGCAYMLYTSDGNFDDELLNIYKNREQICLNEVRNPVCCSDVTGALCRHYGKPTSTKNNTSDEGICSEICKEIADCSFDNTTENWCNTTSILSTELPQNESVSRVQRSSRAAELFKDNLQSSSMCTAKHPEIATQSAIVFPQEFKRTLKRDKRGAGSGRSCHFTSAWTFNCWHMYGYSNYKSKSNYFYWKYEKKELIKKKWTYDKGCHFFKDGCCQAFQVSCGYDIPGDPTDYKNKC